MSEAIRDQAHALLDRAERLGRGEVKRLARALDGEGSLPLREAVVAEARRRGVELPDEAAGWQGKRLLRLARGHEEAARVRTNPIMRDEAFTCLHCGAEVPPMGHTARDHCPHCLRSLHVDVVPGDRANPCGGLMDPVGVELAGERVTIHYRCRACGEQHRNKALLDGAQPDTWRAIVALSKGEG